MHNYLKVAYNTLSVFFIYNIQQYYNNIIQITHIKNYKYKIYIEY